MRPRRSAVPRAEEAWRWLGGLLLLGLLGGGAAAAATLLWEAVDIRQLAPELVAEPGPPPEPELPAAAARPEWTFDAALFVSSRNRGYFEDPDFYPTELGRWEALLREGGGSVRLVHTAQELRDLAPTDLLVVPEAPCLSPAERSALRRHVRSGGDVVTNWAVGVRDEACAWRGWATLLELTGADDVREIPSRAALYMTVPTDLPLSPGLDPGTRVELRPDPAIALRVPGPRVYWSDWALNPAPADDGAGIDAAVSTTTTESGGRVAWFSPRLGQAATPRDSALAHRLVLNGILWAAGVPLAAPTTWPDAARAALVFTLDVESEHRNALHVAEALEADGLTASFYAVSRIVQDDEELAATLTRVGEVGSHSADHTPVAGQTRQSQGVRLRRAADDIRRWTGVAPAGLHPPEEAFDSASLEAWSRAGGRYILGSTRGRSGSPEVHRVDGSALVVLPRALKDDYSVIVRDGAVMTRRISESFLAGTRKMRAIGGLAVVAGHTQIMGSGRRLDAVLEVADTARGQHDWWMTRSDRVAAWWAARADVRLAWVDPAPTPELDGVRPSGLPDLVVEGPGVDLHGLWIDVVAPHDPALLPLVDGHSVEFRTTAWGLRVPIGTLEAGASRRVAFVRVEDG